MHSTESDLAPLAARDAQASPSSPPLLEVENLRVEFNTSHGMVRAVDGVSWSVRPGEVVALVGESGCGKSVTALSILGLLPRPASRISGGAIRFEGRDLAALSAEEMRQLRGRVIAMIFQDPMSSLNPVMTVGKQIVEPLVAHLGMSASQARARALGLLHDVGMTDCERRFDQYPHHLSGGMRQRVMIAIGLACRPRLLIADEPTTALDVTIQAQILELMRDLSRRLGIALVIITHNMGIVARYADRVNVMYAGRIVESGPVDELFATPRHPYTQGLLEAVPRLDRPRLTRLATIEGLPPNLAEPLAGCRFAPRCPEAQDICRVDPILERFEGQHFVACHRAGQLARRGGIKAPEAVLEAVDLVVSATPLLSVQGLSKQFPVGGGRTVQAVHEVSFEIQAGETLGLVGESGCGKTTVSRMILGLAPPSSGRIRFRGEAISSGRRVRELHRNIQTVFQDPYASLNPRMRVRDILAEPLLVHKMVPRSGVADRIYELLDQVGLSPAMGNRYPHQLSGGQRQRVGIARALAMKPAFIVLDEPVSALDVSIQGQIMNLLSTLQRQLGVGYLFIAHDLAVVRHLSHRVVVMYLGRVMEQAGRDDLYDEPLHPYTKALLNAAPIPDPVLERQHPRIPLSGDLPSPLAPPPGCVFSSRCPQASVECTQEVPALTEVRPGRHVACIKVTPC